MPLDGIFARFQRVDILAKYQGGRSVDREAREILQHVGVGAGFCAAPPASKQALGDELQGRKEALELLRGERAHHEIALRAPRFSLGREDTVAAHLLENRFHRGQAPKAGWPILQHGEHHVDVGRHQYPLRTELERIGRSQLFAPFFELGVQLLGIELE